jgi:hypothetical protein
MSPRTQAIGDMALIAFYYLLRVGEYTHFKPTEHRVTHQLVIADIKLWHNTTAVSHRRTTTDLIRLCTSATLSIRNQKNGMQNASIHQEATQCTLCPIRAIIRRIKSITHHTSEMQSCISTYFPTNDPNFPRLLTANDITSAVRRAVTTLGLARNGLTTQLVGSHSLRAGGAMAMYLNGVAHNTIKKMGRWKSDTFLMYIHEQISALSANVSTTMSKPIVFHNIHFDRRQLNT